MNSTELVEAKMPSLPPGWKWQPRVGEETYSLLDSVSLTEPEKQRLLDESVGILASCVPPTAPDSRDAGLVVGNIQSGKTLSFTTVTALARDNGYRIVVLITGTAKILNRQSVARLTGQLRINSRSDFAWRHYHNPGKSAAIQMRDILRDWEFPTPGGLQPQTIVITLLKNHARLKASSELLEQLDLHAVPALVIDDEADQAGLNTAAKTGEESSPYHQLCRLRQALPHHTYLGYTATPQAPLLINIIDMLSARFARVLTPGSGYTGGVAFFDFQPSLIKTIPDNQIPGAKAQFRKPPESLLDAMRTFYLGVGDGVTASTNGRYPHNRSMLVHPSIKTSRHAQFFKWIVAVQKSWLRLLESSDPADSFDKDSLISRFQQAYDDLSSTYPEIASFEALLRVLPQVLRRTGIYEVNARTGNISPTIEDIDEFWRQSYSAILVGGQSLERGFTIEGLTVTYMPRGVGVGHADTIQQRARFYGYNLRILGLCRVYLENAARDAYHIYIEHEDDLRRRLAEYSATGKNLAEWRRMFFLDASMKPTRDNVLDIDYTRGPAPDVPHVAMPPIYSEDDLNENRTLVSRFLNRLSLIWDDGDPRRTEAQRHQLDSNVPIKDLLEQLLVPLRINDPEDSTTYMQISLQIQRYLESAPNAACTVYRMKPDYNDIRSLTEQGTLQPFQGANRATGYAGDVKCRDTRKLTVQIYEIDKVYENKRRQLIATGVPLIVVFLTREIARAMVVQNQGG